MFVRHGCTFNSTFKQYLIETNIFTEYDFLLKPQNQYLNKMLWERTRPLRTFRVDFHMRKQRET